MRRPPQAVIAAHIMDPKRRELYVEGSRDKSFLGWLVGDLIDDNSMIITIEMIDTPEVNEGGNRERIVKFISDIENKVSNVRGLIDADSDYLSQKNRIYPKNVWLTDFRSIESYVISIENLDKTLRLGCSIDHVSASVLYPQIIAASRSIAAIRFLSESENLGLPVGKNSWTKQLNCNPRGGISFDETRALQSLLQAASVGLSELSSLSNKLAEIKSKLSRLDDNNVVHGKDFMAILTKQLNAMKVKIDDAGRFMWLNFDRESVYKYPNLGRVIGYLASKD